MLGSSLIRGVFAPCLSDIACSGSSLGRRLRRSVKSDVLVLTFEKKNAAEAIAPTIGNSAPSCMSSLLARTLFQFARGVLHQCRCRSLRKYEQVQYVRWAKCLLTAADLSDVSTSALRVLTPPYH